MSLQIFPNMKNYNANIVLEVSCNVILLNTKEGCAESASIQKEAQMKNEH